MEYLATTLFTGALSFLFISCMPTKAYANSEPIQTIYNIQQALDSADQVLFDASINVDSVVGQCVDVFIDNAKQVDKKSLPAMFSMMLSAVSKSEAARKKLHKTLVDEVSTFVRYGVRSGAFAGKEFKAEKLSGLLSSLLANASMGRKEITNIGEAIEESGAMFVSFILHDHGNGQSYPIEAWLQQENGRWRVTGIRNVQTLLSLIQGEEVPPVSEV